MRRVLVLVAAVVLSGIIATLPDIAAQDPPPIPSTPSPENATGTPYSFIQIQVVPERGFARLPERSLAVFPVEIRDRSVQGTEGYSSAVPVSCRLFPLVESPTSWAVSYAGAPTVMVLRGGTYRMDLQIATGNKPNPEFFEVNVRCTAGPPVNKMVGNFTIKAQVEEYVYMAMFPSGVVGNVVPDQYVDFTVTLQNGGSHPKRYIGRVEAPDGWTFETPPPVVIEPGESTEVTVRGISPREQMVYISQNDPIRIYYYPEGFPGKQQVAFFPVTVKGVYLHPALVPLTLIALGIIAVLVFLAVLARRAIEEQILGKPIPPWRIPIERDNLRELMKTDPDEYYVLRYYLMVEEHRSALLWFAAYKKATKKDRKREAAWFKVKRKQERKIRREDRAAEVIEERLENKVVRVDRQRDRKMRVLERKLRRKERKEQRKLDRKTRNKFRRASKRHAKRAKRAHVRHEKKLKRENKKVAKENKRRAKRDEEPLPPPELPPPVIEAPQEPERVVVEEKPLDDSMLAKRAERTNRRFDRKRNRKERARDRKGQKARAKARKRTEKLRAKIPPEPRTHLYDSDEYVPEDDVVVEDDRSLIARLLHLSTLEEREAERRRRQVYDARIGAAAAAGDASRAEALKVAKAQELEQRREQRRAASATKKESFLMAREAKKRQARRSADEPPEALSEPPAPQAAVAPPRQRPARSGFRARLGRRIPRPAETEGEKKDAAKTVEE